MLQIIIISGKKNSGKTAYLKEVIEKAKKRQKKVHGFLSEAEIIKGEKNIYYLRDLKTDKRTILASTQQEFLRFINFGRFYFSLQTFEFANSLFIKDMDADLFVFDEYGPLEVDGYGFKPVFNYILDNYKGLFFISVRPAFLNNLIKDIKIHRKINPRI
jgi:nucleoside-triphosphatase THEP1